MGSQSLPSGTVTFLFTDIVGSTRSWAADSDAMSASLQVHDAALRESIESHGGYVFTTAGDAFCAAFARAADGVAAALAVEERLGAARWPGPELRVRIGLHVGDVEARDGDYFGPTVNVAARVASLGHGGQILLTAAAASASGADDVLDLGSHVLPDVDGPLQLFQLGRREHPPLRSSAANELIYRFDEFELHGAARTFSRDGEVIHVEPQVFDVLVHLVANSERLVSREELLDQVWGDQFVSLSALTSRIKSARHALGDDGRTQRYIRTEHGRGYQFVPTPTVSRSRRDVGGAVDEPSSPASSAHSGGAALPRISDRFVGRSLDIEHVLAALAPGTVVSLVGPGGVGKTRLSVESARRWSEATGRQVAFIALDEVREASDVRSALATMLGVDAREAADLIRTCAELLATADGLLVLDNCEHVLDEIADIVEQLLAVAPHLTVLTTSREPLRITGEQVQRLETLPVDGGDPSGAARPGPAVELFVARARASDANFELDAANTDAVLRLCRALDGLPLALELAASRVGSLGLGELAAELKHKLDVTHAGRRDADHRHHSLRSTIEWSYDRLSREAQRLLSALAHFPGGLRYADLDALAHRLDGDAVTAQLVGELIDTSMTSRRGTTEARYSMLETVRDFALERTKSFELGDGIADALIEHARTLADAERACSESGALWQDKWYGRLREEIPNFRAAREVLWERGDLEGLVALSSGLTEFTEESCLAELWGWHDELAHAADEVGPTCRPVALMLVAVSARNRGQFDEAERVALEVVAADTDVWSVMRALNVLAMVQLFRGDPGAASRRWLEMDARTGGLQGHVLEPMCEAYLGNVERADALLDEVAEVARGGGYSRTVGLYCYVAGEVARIAGDEAARELLDRAVTLGRENECWFTFGISQVSLVSTLVADGDTAAAARSYIDLVERWLRSDTWPQLWTTLRNVADLPGEFDDETRLVILAAAERDPQAPALDDAAAEAEAELIEECRDRLGDERADAVVRTARRLPRAEIAHRAVASLRAVGEMSASEAT